MVNIVTQNVDDVPANWQEVVPGSADDPFTVNASPSSNVAPTSPVQPQVGQEPAPAVDGQPNVAPTAQVPAAVVSRPQAPAPAQTTAVPALDDAVKALIAEQVTAAVAPLQETLTKAQEAEARARAAQSAADRRVAELERAQKEAQEAQRRAEREGKLNDMTLTNAERAALQRSYELEDREAAVAAREAEADAYHRELYIVALAQEAGQFGVTAESLEGFNTPEEMDAYVDAVKLAFERAGVAPVTAQVPSTAPVAAAAQGEQTQRRVPAGATAASDLVTQPPAAPARQMRTDSSPDALRENLANMEWETLRMPV